MLRTNLATRPFHNRRAIHLVLGSAALLVAALTVANGLAFSLLTAREREVAGDVMQAEARTLELQRQTRRLRQGLDHAQLEAIATAARHANRLIDRRVFSWTSLLGVVEATLPAEMRVTSMTPETDAEGRLVVAIAVVARRADVVSDFGDARLWSETTRIDLRVAEVANPRPGDRIEIVTFVGGG
jgi:sulfur carrier protein ThiS